jgi:hypothetical protein
VDEGDAIRFLDVIHCKLPDFSRRIPRPESDPGYPDCQLHRNPSNYLPKSMHIQRELDNGTYVGI